MIQYTQHHSLIGRGWEDDIYIKDLSSVCFCCSLVVLIIQPQIRTEKVSHCQEPAAADFSKTAFQTKFGLGVLGSYVITQSCRFEFRACFRRFDPILRFEDYQLHF